MSHIEEGLLHAWLDDEVSANEARTVEEHLESCGSCQRMLDEAARARALAGELMADLTADSVPEWEEIVKRASGAAERSPGVVSPPPAPPSRRLLAPALAWAATLVVAFLLGWQVRLPQGSAREQGQIVAAIEPGMDAEESELNVSVDRESVQQAPKEESRAAASEPDDGAPEPRLATTERKAAMPEPRAAGLEPRVTVPEPEAPMTEQPEQEELKTVRGAAPLRKMAAEGFLVADEVERDKPSFVDPAEVALRGGRQPLRLAGGVLVGPETMVDLAARTEPEARPGVLRAVYQDRRTGVRATLLQRVVDPAERARIGADLGTSPATATFTVPADGLPSLRWLTPDGVLLTLEADLDEADLRQLARRVR